MDPTSKQALIRGDLVEMPTDTYNNPDDSFLQTVTCLLSQKEEPGLPPQYVTEVKCENTVVNAMNEFDIKKEINPLEISKTDENEFEVDNFLRPQHISLVNSSLEESSELSSHFEKKTKMETLIGESEIVTEDLVPDQSEGMRPDDMNEVLSTTIEVKKHDKSKPEWNNFPRSPQKHTKTIRKSHNSEHSNGGSNRNRLAVGRGKRYRKKTCDKLASSAWSSAVKKWSVNKQDTKETFSCATCSQTFPLYNLYQKHEETGVCQRRICPYCKKVFLHSTKLKYHIISHTGEKSFCCAHCMKMFGRKDSLIAHIRLLHIGLPGRKSSSESILFYCPICNKSLASRGSLYEHKKLHSDIKPFQCAHCNQSYHLKGYLRQHILCMHSEERHVWRKTYHCFECGNSFAKKSTLVRHSVTHSIVKPFICNECGRSFTRAHTVKLHKINVHGDRKVNELGKCNSSKLQFICEYCAKIFSCRGTLEGHIRIHTAERPFECRFCNKRWTTKGSLKQHIISHRPEKSFVCNFCEKVCNAKGNLKQHIKIHLAESPFVCNFCDKGWNTKGILKQHIETHLKDPFH